MSRSEYDIRPSFLYALSLSGMAICIVSSFGYEVQYVPLGTPFGLFGLLPMGYWIGILFLVISLAIGLRTGTESVFFVQSMLLFLALWCAPAMFEKYPTVWDSYVHYDASLAIVREGIVPNTAAYNYAYNYPGFFVLGASFALLGDPPALLFLRLYPIFSATLTVAAIYLFARTYVPRMDHRLAFLFAAFANVWLQFNYSPQSMGLVAGLLIFVCLEREGREWLYAALMLFAFIVVSHPTTLIFVLGAIAIKEVFNRILYFTIGLRRPTRWERPWPVGVFILIWLGWFFTGASSFSLNLVQFISNRLFMLGQVQESVSEQWAMRGTSENILGVLYPQLRTGMLGVFLALTLLALLIYLLSRNRRHVNFPRNILALFLLPLGIIPLDMAFFNGQLYDRGILYLALVAPIIFVPILITNRKKVVRAGLSVAISLVVVAAASTIFYQEALYINNDRAVDVADFLAGNAPHTIVGGGFYPVDVWDDAGEQFDRIKISALYNMSIGNIARFYGGGTILFDDTTEMWYRQWGTIGMYDFYRDQAPYNYRVYDNGGAWVMYIRGA